MRQTTSLECCGSTQPSIKNQDTSRFRKTEELRVSFFGSPPSVLIDRISRNALASGSRKSHKPDASAFRLINTARETRNPGEEVEPRISSNPTQMSQISQMGTDQAKDGSGQQMSLRPSRASLGIAAVVVGRANHPVCVRFDLCPSVKSVKSVVRLSRQSSGGAESSRRDGDGKFFAPRKESNR